MFSINVFWATFKPPSSLLLCKPHIYFDLTPTTNRSQTESRWVPAQEKKRKVVSPDINVVIVIWCTFTICEDNETKRKRQVLKIAFDFAAFVLNSKLLVEKASPLFFSFDLRLNGTFAELDEKKLQCGRVHMGEVNTIKNYRENSQEYSVNYLHPNRTCSNWVY